MIVAAALAGCGGGSDSSDTAPTTAAGASSTSGGEDGGQFCDLIKSYSDRLANLGQASANPDQLREFAEDVSSAIKGAVDAAPADIKPDVTVVAGAAENYLAALKEAGYDLAKVPPEAAQIFQAPDVAPAATRLQAYGQSACGIRG